MKRAESQMAFSPRVQAAGVCVGGSVPRVPNASTRGMDLTSLFCSFDAVWAGVVRFELSVCPFYWGDPSCHLSMPYPLTAQPKPNRLPVVAGSSGPILVVLPPSLTGRLWVLTPTGPPSHPLGASTHISSLCERPTVTSTDAGPPHLARVPHLSVEQQERSHRSLRSKPALPRPLPLPGLTQ